MSEKVEPSLSKASPAEISEFKRSLRGKLILPSDPEYEEGRQIWNGMIDKHPSMIVRCAGVSDVISSVNFARTHRLEVAVRGGGHNVAGNAVSEGGLVVDFSRMKSIRVDPVGRTVRAEPGVIWREFDQESQQFGLATTGGLVSTTGVAGFTLGGGIGWLVRKYGTTSDNLLSADVVTAEGKLIRASSNENRDLFWGIRGGGGNFGIVTSFEYRVHEVGPIVLGGMVVHPVSNARDLLSFHREFVKTNPHELTTIAAFLTAPPAPFLPSSIHNTQVVAVVGCYCGSIEEGEKALKPLRSFGHPVADLFQPMPYRVLQSLLDEAAPPRLQNYWKSGYLPELGDDAIKTIIEHNASVPSPLTAIHLHHLGGQFAREGENDSAFSHREAQFAMNIVSTWMKKEDSEKNVRWTREFFESMRRFTSGVYVNFLGEEGEERVRSAYSESKLKRLGELKKKYDPSNFFHLNQNIKPT